MEEQGALRVRRLGLDRRLLDRADPFAQLAKQARPCRQRRVPRLEGQRHGHLRQPGQGRHQLELVWRQVVEPIEEDGAIAPEGAVAAQQRDCLAGDPVRVDSAAVLADLGVAGKEGGDVAEVGRSLQGRGTGLDGVGADSGRLQLVQQAVEGAGEAGREAERPNGPRRRSRAATATSIARSRCAGESSAPGGRPPAVATVRNSAPKVIAAPPSAAPPAQSSRSKAKTSSTLGTTRIGSRSKAATNRRRTRPARPELGGPWIRLSGMAASDPA